MPGYSASNAGTFSTGALGGNAGINLNFGPNAAGGSTANAPISIWAWIGGGIIALVLLAFYFLRKK